MSEYSLSVSAAKGVPVFAVGTGMMPYRAPATWKTTARRCQAREIRRSARILVVALPLKAMVITGAMGSPELEVRLLASAAVMRDHRMVKTVPLADGDLAWVFPGQWDAQALMALLTASSGRVAEISRLLRADQAGAAGPGLEYVIYPGRSRRRLWGHAENSQVTFEMEAVPAGDSHEDPASWDVRAEVSVRCEARYDASCGTHVIEELELAGCATAEETAAAVDRATAWLLARCRVVPPVAWRTREPLRPCQGHD